MAEILKQLGAQKGGEKIVIRKNGQKEKVGDDYLLGDGESFDLTEGGRRRRHSKSHKGNSWLDHVKYTMKEKKNKGKSFKQILKLAKKSYKKSQSQSGGKRSKSARKGQHGGSGGKVAGVGESAYPYV